MEYSPKNLRQSMVEAIVVFMRGMVDLLSKDICGEEEEWTIENKGMQVKKER